MSGYWEKRAMADEQRAHRAASEVNADIKRLYQRQYKKIYANMERLYGQADWGEAHRITRTQLWQYSQWKAMEQDLRQFATNTPKIEIEKLTGTLNGVFKDTIGADVSRFSGQEGVKFRVSADPMTVVNTAWSGEAYSSRIWKNTSVIAERIQSDMEDMMVSGRSLKDIKKQLMQDFSIGYNEAARLVDTEAAYVMNSAAKQRYKADGITKIRWLIGMEDGKECEICKSRANKVWHIDTAPPMPAHPRCRCTWVGVVEVGDENVPCDGEEESAQEAQKTTEPKTVKAEVPEEKLRLPNTSQSAMIDDRREDTATEDGDGVKHSDSEHVNYLSEINRSIYERISRDITTQSVVITDERICHIQERHPGDWESYGQFLDTTLTDPDYILKDKNPHTAICIRKIRIGEVGKCLRTTLRLHVAADIVGRDNSVLTFQKINLKEYGRLSRNKNCFTSGNNRGIISVQDKVWS